MSPQKNLATKFAKVFETEYLSRNLGSLSVRGGTITMLGQLVKFTLQMTSIIVLARILSPDDYGLIAMVIAITGFLALFKDMGLSMATVQRAEIDHGQISTLFWFNVALGAAIMLFLSVIAPAIAWFYSEPRLVWVTIALSTAFVFGGLTVQHQSLLRRQMRFARLAAIEIISIAAGVVVAIVSALYGAGYWALVFMQMTIPICIAIGVWLACEWRPGLPVRDSGVRSMLAFGGNITGFNAVNYFARNLDKVLIGWYWGTQPLGFYERAYRLLMLPLQQINAPLSALAIPALSRLQDNPERYRRFYLKAVSLIGFVTMPGVMFVIIMSKPIIRLVLGEQWIETSKIFAILGISALIQPIHNTSGWLYVSIGATDRMFKYGMIYSTIVVISFFIGLPFGAVGVATCYTICILLVFIPWLHYACKATPVDVPSIAKMLWPTVTATLVSGGILAFLKVVEPNLVGSVLRLVGSFIGYAIIFLTALCTLSRSLRPIREVINLAALVRGQKKLNIKDSETKR